MTPAERRRENAGFAAERPAGVIDVQVGERHDVNVGRLELECGEDLQQRTRVDLAERRGRNRRSVAGIDKQRVHPANQQAAGEHHNAPGAGQLVRWSSQYD